jgi:N4-gp56 family major capsid protein
MASDITKIADLINPEVMADIISGKITKKIVVSPFARVDTTLQGRPGDTITVPKYAYIGDAGEVAEGASVETAKLTSSTTKATVKKAMKAVTLTDEAVLSGYGDPLGQVNKQLADSIAAKLDEDAMTTLQTATLSAEITGIISYDGIINAIDKFEEELNTEKVMFVHPKQVTQLRLDSNFISADKYGLGTNVIMSGEIGMIANCRIVPTKKVPVKSNKYVCPIVKLTADTETEDEISAMTIYIKRDTNVETERNTLSRTTDISADKIYAVALTDASKVVLAKFAQNATA